MRKLSPGTYALWQLGSLREARYWTPPDGDASPAASAANAPVRRRVFMLCASWGSVVDRGIFDAAGPRTVATR